jgi:NADH:ubiquinone oxidoreductase subunit 6 (subunit J)
MFFILLGAEYLAIMQILVYVGAVAVLMAFAIMLTRRRMKPLSEEEEERERIEELREEEELMADYHSDTFDGGEE